VAVEAFDASDMESQMSASIVLVGAALAIAAVVGVLQPPGHRCGALFAIAAGAGVGIAGLGLGVPSISEGTDTAFWWVFFLSSIAGFVTVIGVLVLTWRRARRLGDVGGPAPSIH
jgi:hypothetical protein